MTRNHVFFFIDFFQIKGIVVYIFDNKIFVNIDGISFLSSSFVCQPNFVAIRIYTRLVIALR